MTQLFESPEMADFFDSPERKKIKNSFVRTIRDGIKENKSWVAIIEEVLGYADYFVETIKPEIKEKPQCKAGCSYCCYLQVHLSRLELKLILDHVQNLPLIEQKRVQRVTAVNRQKIENNPHKKRVELKLPCPFLKNRKCTIYKIRPLNCRGYNSLKVSDCKKGFGKEAILVQEGNQYIIYYSALLALVETEAEFSKIVDLPKFLGKDTSLGDLLDGLS